MSLRVHNNNDYHFSPETILEVPMYAILAQTLKCVEAVCMQ
jgi:hypothetical protein